MNKEPKCAEQRRAFSDHFFKTMVNYRGQRHSQRERQPWDDIINSGATRLKDIPAEEFARRVNSLTAFDSGLMCELIGLTDFLEPDARLIERAYCVYNELDARPSCKHCGKELVAKKRFRMATNPATMSGYGTYCGIRCSSGADDTVTKRKATNRERYGGNAPASSPEIQAKMQATSKTNHGEEFYARTDSSKERFTELFGGATPFASAATQAKAKATIKERYGVNNVMGVQELADKAGAGRMRHHYERLTDPERVGEVEPLFAADEYKGVMLDRGRGIPHRYPWRCKDCDTEFVDSLETDSSSGHNRPRCPQCFPHYVSMGEVSLRKVVADAVGGQEVIWGDRTLLDGQEVDILIPGLKLAIEYNGLYWHSETAGGKAEAYHQNKLSRLSEMGYRLIYVWEDEWHQQQEAIRHVVAEACGGGTLVSTDDCTIVTGKQYASVVGTYHREGTLGGVVTAYALITPDGEPSAVLQVAQRPSKKAGQKSKAALRYTVANGYRVDGGFEALLSAVVKRVKGSKVFRVEIDPSFDDIKALKEAGFTLASEGKAPQQWYLAKPYKFNRRLSKPELIERIRHLDPTLKPDTHVYASRLQAVDADRVWGVKRQVWEYHHKP